MGLFDGFKKKQTPPPFPPDDENREKTFSIAGATVKLTKAREIITLTIPKNNGTPAYLVIKKRIGEVINNALSLSDDSHRNDENYILTRNLIATLVDFKSEAGTEPSFDNLAAICEELSKRPSEDLQREADLISGREKGKQFHEKEKAEFWRQNELEKRIKPIVLATLHELEQDNQLLFPETFTPNGEKTNALVEKAAETLIKLSELNGPAH